MQSKKGPPFLLCKHSIRLIKILVCLTWIFYPVLDFAQTIETADKESQSEESQNAAKEIALPGIEIKGEQTLSAASDKKIRNRDFMNFPRKTASDLMRFIPGLHITQHTGGAKAHQVFLRGFDAEHGQDIAAFLDGIPLNESSHVHGQGYLDLHFIIPESIATIKVMKGPYDSRYGNFATAGVINFIPYTVQKHNYSFGAGVGNKNTYEGICRLFNNWDTQNTYIAIEHDKTDGYTNPGELKAGRAFLNHCINLSGGRRLKFMYAGYTVHSKAADILPKSYIEMGYISRFDSFDNSNKVDVDRHLIGITFDVIRSNYKACLQAYYNLKRTNIFSNYTFYYFNPLRGDQLEQKDHRQYMGIQGSIKRTDTLNSIKLHTECGFSIRSDIIEQTQANTEKRERFNVINNYDFIETALGSYIDANLLIKQWLKIIAGVRYDIILYKGKCKQDIDYFNIYTNLPDTQQDVSKNFNTYSHSVSPKASLIMQPFKKMDIFINFGRGFVSSQARKIAWEPDHSLPAVTGGETGIRGKLWKDHIDCAGAVWIADKGTEYIFDSESGTSIPMGKSRRVGLDFEIRVSPWKWIYIGTDVNYVRARFIEGNEPISNMSEWTMTNIISVIHPDSYKGSVRGRYLGPRKHDLDFHSADYYIIDLLLGCEVMNVELMFSVENVFDTVWYDSVFAYRSRPEQGGEEIAGLHVTPGTPRMFKLHADYSF